MEAVCETRSGRTSNFDLLYEEIAGDFLAKELKMREICTTVNKTHNYSKSWSSATHLEDFKKFHDYIKTHPHLEPKEPQEVQIDFYTHSTALSNLSLPLEDDNFYRIQSIPTIAVNPKPKTQACCSFGETVETGLCVFEMVHSSKPLSLAQKLDQLEKNLSFLLVYNRNKFDPLFDIWDVVLLCGICYLGKPKDAFQAASTSRHQHPLIAAMVERNRFLGVHCPSAGSHLRNGLAVVQSDVDELAGDMKEVNENVDKLAGDMKEVKTNVDELAGDMKELKAGLHTIMERLAIEQSHAEQSDCAASTWTVEQVVEWLKTVFLSVEAFDNISRKFIQNKISGKVLLSLTNATLKEDIGVEAFGDRHDLLSAIEKLKQ